MTLPIAITPESLARRLRQAVQGCTIHMHGPVQAWWAIQEASVKHDLSPARVGELVVASCHQRILDLEMQGALTDDPRILKERRTAGFVGSLLSVEIKEKGPRMPPTRQLEILRDSVAPHLDLVAQHQVYARIHTIEHVRTFMEHHVFAVWDFMCLLKALQRVTTCVDVPWIPRGDTQTRRFINETVLDEETDVLPDGTSSSHFEMYVDAMREVGADTGPILQFVDLIREGHLLHVALHRSNAPAPAREFVMSTMDVINMGRPHSICAAFTVGREHAIPRMFTEVVAEIADLGTQVTKLRYYLERHIEVDGEKHGPIASRMLENLCGDASDRWMDATGTAVVALQARKRLWDAVSELLR